VREAAGAARGGAMPLRPASALKKYLVIPITRHMKALDRPLVRPLLIVLLAALVWTVWVTDFGVNL